MSHIVNMTKIGVWNTETRKVIFKYAFNNNPVEEEITHGVGAIFYICNIWESRSENTHESENIVSPPLILIKTA